MSRLSTVNPTPDSSDTACQPSDCSLTDDVRSHDLSFEIVAADVLGQLCHSVAKLFAAANGATETCTGVQETFGLDPKLAWQVFRLGTAENPLSAGAVVPARISMERLLRSAARRRISGSVVQEVASAFDGFEQFVASHAGDRATLNAMLSAFLPEARAKQELASKQAAFTGISQLRGLASDAEVECTFVVPSQDPNRVDTCSIDCQLGIRRVHPHAYLGLGSGDFSEYDGQVQTIDRVAARSAADTLLVPFCSSPLPRFERVQYGDRMVYSIAGRSLGLKSSTDIVACEYRPSVLKRYRTDDGRNYTGIGTLVNTPSKRLTIDAFFHADVFPNMVPELKVYDTVPRGFAPAFEDPGRDRDLYHVREELGPIPGGPRLAGLKHAPRYGELLTHVCGKLGWNVGDFRGFRVDVQYPIYGASYLVGFRLPPALPVSM